MSKDNYTHFKGKNAIDHVLEVKAKASVEPHGFELPAHQFAFLDAIRNISLLGLILFALLFLVQPNDKFNTLILSISLCGATLGFAARSTWHGWSLLERLHRNLKQEHFEIQHHRAQEREELKAMYQLKGFQEPLLSQVIDVLMADESRLLKVMIEEELGLSLNSHEHPLKHGFAALIGGGCASIILSIVFNFLSPTYFVFFAFLLTFVSSLLSAYKEKNSLIPATVWSLGIAGLVFGLVYFTTQICLVYSSSDSKEDLSNKTSNEITYLIP